MSCFSGKRFSNIKLRSTVCKLWNIFVASRKPWQLSEVNRVATSEVSTNLLACISHPVTTKRKMTVSPSCWRNWGKGLWKFRRIHCLAVFWFWRLSITDEKWLMGNQTVIIISTIIITGHWSTIKGILSSSPFDLFLICTTLRIIKWTSEVI